MRRKGETFTEFLMAAAVFGVMMTGIFEFMANQTDNLAKIRHIDDVMYYAQKYLNTSKKPPEEEQELKNAINALKEEAGKENITIEPDENGEKLTIKKGSKEFSFALKP